MVIKSQRGYARAIMQGWPFDQSSLLKKKFASIAFMQASAIVASKRIKPTSRVTRAQERTKDDQKYVIHPSQGSKSHKVFNYFESITTISIALLVKYLRVESFIRSSYEFFDLIGSCSPLVQNLKNPLSSITKSSLSTTPHLSKNSFQLWC